MPDPPHDRPDGARGPDDARGLADALDELVGTEYEQQVFVAIDGAPEGRSLDVVHSADDIEGDPLPATGDTGQAGAIEGGDSDDTDDGDQPFGRYLVYVAYAPGPPFAERGVPTPSGTLLIDDDGVGATVALPPLPVAAVIDVLCSWAAALLGGPATGDLVWSTTFDDDDNDLDDDW